MKKIIPPIKKGGVSKYGFDQLTEYGDYVFISNEFGDKAKVAAYKYAKYHGIKIAIRSVEGGINVYHAGE